MLSDYDDYDALGLAELVRTGQMTPLELVEEAIRHIEVANPAVNAVIYKMYEQARAAAQGSLPDGPFCGVPFLVKDLGAMVTGCRRAAGRAGSRSGCRRWTANLCDAGRRQG